MLIVLVEEVVEDGVYCVIKHCVMVCEGVLLPTIVVMVSEVCVCVYTVMCVLLMVYH